MKFVESSFEYIPQEPGIEGMLKQIEKACRICYKTENLIKDGSAEKLINTVIIPKKHTSVLEFGVCYLFRSFELSSIIEEDEKWIEKYENDRFTRVNEIIDDNVLYIWITTNYRTIMQGDYLDPIESMENGFDKNWKDDLKYWSEPTEFHYKKYCYKFIMDRVGTQSCERHRGFFGNNFAQESTRYVNYNRDKFEHELTFCLPSKFYQLIDEWSQSNDSLTGEKYSWLKDASIEDKLTFLRCHDRGWVSYENALENAEKEYMYLVGEEDWKPEDARGVLNLDIKSEFLMQCYPEDWSIFFYRRNDKHAHPQIQKISKELIEDFKKRYKETQTLETLYKL